MKNVRKLNESQVRVLIRNLIKENVYTDRDDFQSDPVLRQFAMEMESIHSPHGMTVRMDSGRDSDTGQMRDTFEMEWTDDVSGKTVVVYIYSKDGGYIAGVDVEDSGTVDPPVEQLKKPARNPEAAFGLVLQRIIMFQPHDDVLDRWIDVLESP